MTNTPSKPVHTFHINTQKDFLEKNNIVSICIKTAKDSIAYELLHHDVNTLCYDDNMRRSYNSVIIQPQSRKILSLFTPKCSKTNYFQNKNPFNRLLRIYKMEEGLHIQLFYEPRNFSWQIASKYSIGGNVMYQYNNSFIKQSEIFVQTLGYHGYNINELPLLKTLPKQYCYHFIVQHPGLYSNKEKIQKKAIFLANVIETEHNNEKNNIRLLCLQYIKDLKLFENTNIQYPEILPNVYDSYKTCIFHTSSIYNNNSGIIIENIYTKERTIIKNPNHVYRNYIQYMNPQKIFDSICINHIKKVNVLSQYSTIQNHIVTCLHNVYLDTYINKIPNIPCIKKFTYHIRALHKWYIYSLNKKKKCITKSVILKYLNTLHPKELLDLVYGNCETYSI
jgi:hypothetical protein